MISAARPASHSREWLFFVVPLLLAVLAGCGAGRDAVQLSGRAMGTSWHVTYLPAARGEPAPATVQEAIEAALERVNGAMSTYREDSEISAVNRLPAGAAVTVSEDFARVLDAGLAIGRASDGAYDVTVGPLVRLWGFGPGGGIEEIPAADSIAAMRMAVGQQQLEWDAGQRRLRKPVARELDFSSIAKGYAVDLVVDALAQLQLSDYLVEVGGEMRVSGHSPRGDAWRVAIELPDPGRRAVQRTISLSRGAVATSGDYRNFFELGGERYSHSIDPRTGYPVRHDLVSVTVIHDSAMWADGWATALTVLGMPAALQVAEAQGLAVYLLQRDGEGFASSHSAAFAPYLVDDDS
jgi:thiamine biosynthesis lipoprotein